MMKFEPFRASVENYFFSTPEVMSLNFYNHSMQQSDPVSWMGFGMANLKLDLQWLWIILIKIS